MMSQITNVCGYASCSFEGIPIDALQYLTPNDELYPRESNSQSPSESHWNSDSDLPDLPDLIDNRVRYRAGPQAPDILTRIKPDSINEYILLTTDISAELFTWCCELPMETSMCLLGSHSLQETESSWYTMVVRISFPHASNREITRWITSLQAFSSIYIFHSS